MISRKLLYAGSLACLAPFAASAADGYLTTDGYYATVRVIGSHHQARNMDASARPGIGRFVPGDERQRFVTGSVALGRAYGNGWRSEGEYVPRRNDTYSSGSSIFATSFNNHEVRSQRLMFNAYRDVSINAAWAVYASAGAGLSHMQSAGWQGNETRQYAKATRTGLAWSLGAGVSLNAGNNLALDLGYRYVDLGHTESGWNTFGNARGLQDEKMSLDLVSREVMLALRYAF